MSTELKAFPEVIKALPKVNIGLEGADLRLSQADGHQILFMEFSKDVELPEHSHEAQWGIVLKGQIELVIAGKTHHFEKGDSYFIPAGVLHSARIFAGYADVTFFDAPNRYTAEA